MAFLDQNFNVYEMTDEQYTLVKQKFEILKRMKNLKQEDVEDMMQNWFLRKCRLGNTSFIHMEACVMFNRAHYRNEYVNSDDVEETLLLSDAQQELIFQLKEIYNIVNDKFGKKWLDIFVEYTEGTNKLTLSKKYGYSEPTMRRRITNIQKYVRKAVA